MWQACSELWRSCRGRTSGYRMMYCGCWRAAVSRAASLRVGRKACHMQVVLVTGGCVTSWHGITLIDNWSWNLNNTASGWVSLTQLRKNKLASVVYFVVGDSTGVWIVCVDVAEHTGCWNYLRRWNSVPKRQHRKFRRRGIRQKKECNMKNMPEGWNQVSKCTSCLTISRPSLSLRYLIAQWSLYVPPV